MIDSLERFVLMYDLTLKTVRNTIETPPFPELAAALLARANGGESLLVLRPYSDDSDAAPWLRIKNARVVKGKTTDHLALLFSVGDPRAANPVFEHADTAILREIEKEEREGKAVTAHCIISMEPIKQGRHRVIVEDIRGLGKTRLRDMLGSELKHISRALGLSYTNGSGDDVDTYVIPNLEGYASEKLKTSLARGTISGVWLVDTTTDKRLDEVPSAKMARREFKFEAPDVPTIEKLKAWGAENKFDKMRLVWNDPEGTGKPERASVDITQNDVSETFFVRQRKIKLDRPLAEAVKSLRKDVVEKMIAI